MLTSTRRATLFGAVAASGFMSARVAAAKPTSDAAAGAMARLLMPWSRADRPGVSVTAVLDGKTVYSRGFGAADLENGVPITHRTIFNVASVSKQFTAYAVLLLAAEGKLSMDDPVERHLPEVAGPIRRLSLRQLAHHTAGLRDQYSLLKAAGWREDDAVTEEQLRRLIFRQTGLNFAPGDRFQYTNTGYFLLAQVVGRVAGLPLAAFARERIFQPLGMRDTQFHDDNARLVARRAHSYLPDGKGFEAAILNDESVGPSSILTTSEDLCRWASAFEGPLGQSPGMVAMREQATLNDGSVHYYAMGQESHLYNGLRTWSHGGRDGGFRSFLLRAPDQRFSVAVLSNTSAFDAAAIAYATTDIYLGGHPDFVAPGAVAPGQPDAAALARFAGAYELFPGLILMLSSDGASLSTAWLGGRTSTRMKALSPSSFEFDPAANISLEFDPTERGRPAGLKYRIGRNGVLDAPRIDLAPFDKASVNLADYVGRYRCADLAAEYELILNGERLVARHQRLADIALTPYQPDLLHSFEAFFGRLKFERNGRGTVRGFTLGGAVAEGLWFERLG